MLKQIPNPASKQDIENAIYEWLELLANEQYAKAYNFTLHDPYYQWNAIAIEQVINGYGLPYDASEGLPKCKVTPWSSAQYNGSKYYKEITLFENIRPYNTPNSFWIGEVYYDLPIDGEWSDLTATFKIIKTDLYTTLELNDIHVM